MKDEGLCFPTVHICPLCQLLLPGREGAEDAKGVRRTVGAVTERAGGAEELKPRGSDACGCRDTLSPQVRAASLRGTPRWLTAGPVCRSADCPGLTRRGSPESRVHEAEAASG